MLNEDAFHAFKTRCIDALTKREYSRAELAAKASGIDDETVEAVMTFLQEKGWQSDARFAKDLAQSKAARGDGPLKVRLSLRKHRLADNLIDEVVDAIDWFEIAQKLYRKKYSSEVNSLAERARRQRFMIQRGFTFEHIDAAMKS